MAWRGGTRGPGRDPTAPQQSGSRGRGSSRPPLLPPPPSETQNRPGGDGPAAENPLLSASHGLPEQRSRPRGRLGLQRQLRRAGTCARRVLPGTFRGAATAPGRGAHVTRAANRSPRREEGAGPASAAPPIPSGTPRPTRCQTHTDTRV